MITLLLTELAHVVRCECKVGLAASNEDAYVLARDALMLLLDDSGGRARRGTRNSVRHPPL